jgi:receptor expression-enhancing protein 5/6
MQYALVAGVMSVMFGVGSSYITNLIGVAYPAFMSFLALESDGLEDDKQWLTYWVCFGAFNIIDQFAGIILTFIPFYYFLKLGFLVYLFHPSTLGATTVYNTVIIPRLQQYEKHLAEFEQKASTAFESAKEQVGGFTKKEQ